MVAVGNHDGVTESEVHVLGALLRDAEAAEAALALEPEAFRDERHAAIFRSAVRLHSAGHEVTPTTVETELDRTGRLEQVGGFEYLTELFQNGGYGGIGYHVERLQEEQRRQELKGLGRALELAADRDDLTELGELEERLHALRNGTGPSGRFTLRSDVEMEEIDPPPQLINGILPVGGLGALVGPPGTGKTFLGLDWSFSVQSEIRWIDGRSVHPGQVVYVLAEGSASLGPRIGAWKEYQLGDRPPEDRAVGVQFVTQPVPLMDDGAVSDFLGDLDAGLERAPVLVVFDTLARCMVGGDENSAKDMGLLIAGADRVREETGATVLLLHHTTKSGEVERGSSALRGATDTLMKMKMTDDGFYKLECEKQKDAPPFDPIEMGMMAHAESAILTARPPMAVDDTRLHESVLDTLGLLSSHAPLEGMSTTRWLAVSEKSERTFYRHLSSLTDGGYVDRNEQGNGVRYTLSEKGREVLP